METRLSSRGREVVISGDRPFVIIGERINPTGRKVLAAEMKDGRMDRVRSDAIAQGAAAVSSSATPGGSFAQCVIARESGGQSQVMNGSGHYGLYQFSASTWAAYGGSPADFGNASVSEQNQVFNNAIASGGQSNWSAYDGC